MKITALFLLAAVALLGCSHIRDSRRPTESADDLLYRKSFEAGRRAEARNDFKIAGDTYGFLIGRGNRYGEYGLALLLLRREPGSRDAVKHLIACAKRSSHTSALFPDSDMDSAFSVAAMAKLSAIAVSEHDRRDVAASLRSMMSDVVTPRVKAWAARMKTDADSAAIYKDIIAAVEACRPVREYVKAFTWPEVTQAFAGDGGAPSSAPTPSRSYTVVKFIKTPGAKCQYDFEVRLAGSNTFEASGKVRSDIRRQLVQEFLAENPHDGVDDVRLSFNAWQQVDSTITGSAVVMRVSAVRLEYNQITRRGTIAVRLDGRDVGGARKWALDNIEELVTGKNIALVVGKPPPPGARYTLGSERMTEDGLLEITFTVED